MAAVGGLGGVSSPPNNDIGGGGGGGGAQPPNQTTVQLLFFACEIARVYTVINLYYDIQKSLDLSP